MVSWSRPVCRAGLALILLVGSLVACGGGGDASAPTNRRTSTTVAASGRTEPPGEQARVARLQGWLGVDTARPVVVGTVGPEGGDIVATAGALEGLRLRVPADSYPEPVEIAVKAGEIVDWSYGTAIDPISPLLTVTAPDVLANHVIEVQVPATVPPGKFAMGVLYDAATSELEPLPLVTEDASSVTVAVRHFSSFFLTAVDLAGLPDELATGFVPKLDAWQFPNYGSYVQPAGICAGMSLAAMWYFLEVAGKDPQAPRLYDTYDNDGLGGPPDFWYDDAHAIRFATMVQTDVDWSSLVREVSKSIASRGLDDLQYAAIRYAIYLTGEPQYIAIADSQGASGHALVAYAVSPDQVWVSDPNHPGAARSIRLDPETARWMPYSSGPDATAIEEGKDVAYTQVALVAKSALVGWDAIRARFDQLEAGTIGDDRFPAVRLTHEVVDASGATTYPSLPLTFTTDLPSLWVSTDGPGQAYLFRGSASTRASQTVDSSGLKRLDLQPGVNVVRAAFLAPVGGREEFVDFQTYTITMTETTTTVAPPPTAPPGTTPTTIAPPACGCAPDDALCLLDCDEVPDVPSQPPGA